MCINIYDVLLPLRFTFLQCILILIIRLPNSPKHLTIFAELYPKLPQMIFNFCSKFGFCFFDFSPDFNFDSGHKD